MTNETPAPSKAATRIYKVVETGAKDVSPRLVKAKNPAQALKHVVTPRFAVRVAEMDEVVELVQKGTQVEIAATEE